jgi:hypothetical protein
MDVNGDLLTAAGMLLATLGLLFTAWYPEISSATQVSSGGKLADRGPRIAQVNQALFLRAVPLLVAIVFIVVACGPPAVSVVVHAFGRDWGRPYDPVRALFIGVWALTIGMGVAVAAQVRKLFAKRRSMHEPDH